MGRGDVDPSATLLVGDSLVDWQTARRASAAACVARYGFGFDTLAARALCPDDRVIDEPAELLTL
jgi:phosphoglycolate phosphatase-like HAD superfamily hydrolase